MPPPVWPITDGDRTMLDAPKAKGKWRAAIPTRPGGGLFIDGRAELIYFSNGQVAADRPHSLGIIYNRTPTLIC